MNASQMAVAEDALDAVRAARLRYLPDCAPGIRRRRAGASFRYVYADGRPVHDPEEIRRIRKLAIPPAWTDVWICPFSNGHVQATGRDARGRKQYRYHTAWREIRDETKFNRMIRFAETLPRIRARVGQDLGLPGLPRDKVLATIVRLLELTSIRVGNEEYARANRSFGLTTLRDRHVAVQGARIEFVFRGKSRKQHSIRVEDAHLAKIVKRCQDIPGYELFQYIDEAGRRVSIGSSDVNAYLRTVSGDDFTAKDFRTWAGTVEAASALAELGGFSSARQAKRNVVEAISRTAELLGNTPAICRKSYVHPAVVDTYLEGKLVDVRVPPRARNETGLRPEERQVLALLRQRLALESQPLSEKLAASLAERRARRTA
jgi:DNA topoisomerase-1